MTCTMHGLWVVKAAHWIVEGSSVDCSSRVIEEFKNSIIGCNIMQTAGGTLKTIKHDLEMYG